MKIKQKINVRFSKIYQSGENKVFSRTPSQAFRDNNTSVITISDEDPVAMPMASEGSTSSTTMTK